MKLPNITKNAGSANIIKGMITLAKGAILARILGFISIPILTRLYSPEDYGVLALYTSLVAIVAPTLTLRYVQAIPIPKTDIMALNLFVMCIKLIFFNSLIITIVFIFFSVNILRWFDLEALDSWWPLIILGSMGTALYELFSLWATRKKQYKVIAKTQVLQSLLGNLTKIVLGLVAFKTIGLIFGQVIAQSCGISNFIKQSSLSFNERKHKINFAKGKFITKYYKDFPIYRLPSHILMVVSLQAPVLMMAALFNKEVTGQLSLTILALSLPTSMIASAISKAYYAEIASLGKNNIDKIKNITFSIQKKLFSIGIPLTIIIIVTSKFLFIHIFGNEWGMAGEFASLLAPFILFQFTSSPLMEVINIVGSQISFLIIHSIRIIGLSGLFFFSKMYEVEEITFVLLLSSYLSIFYLLASCFVFLTLKRAS